MTVGSLGGPNQGGFDTWVAKYSGPGRLRWKTQLGTSQMDISWGVAIDGEGSVYISGETRGSLAAENQAEGSTDAWLAKYSGKGVHHDWLARLRTHNQ